MTSMQASQVQAISGKITNYISHLEWRAMIPARVDKIELEHLHFLLSMAFIDVQQQLSAVKPNFLLSTACMQVQQQLQRLSHRCNSSSAAMQAAERHLKYVVCDGRESDHA